MRRRSRRAIVASLAVAGTLVAAGSAHAASIVDDPTGKTLTLTGSAYELVLDYDHKAVIKSLRIDGHQLLDPAGSAGIYSALYDGAWTTTLSLAADPTVAVAGNVATVTLDTAKAHEVWTFTVSDPEVQFALDREYTSSGTYSRMGTPTIAIDEGTIENMRWRDDGGNYPVGGPLLNTWAPSSTYPWYQEGAKINANVVTAKQQVSFDLLDRASSTALGVSASSNHAGAQHEATEVRRETTGDLRLDLLTSSAPLSFASGSVLGYNQSAWDRIAGRARLNGAPIFTPTSVSSGQHDVMTVTFTPKDHAAAYDLGTLKGVDDDALSRVIHDYGRWMLQDALHGGAANETPVMKNEVPPLEMHWNANMVSIFGSPESIEAFQNGLEDIRDWLQYSTGRIGCCYPGLPKYWAGDTYSDNMPGYALGVVKAYELSGDDTWLASFKTSVERALDFLIDPANGRVDATTKLAKVTQCNASSGQWCNDYWQKSTGVGGHNGYISILLYDALVRWSTLEAEVLGDFAKAGQYSTYAAALKNSLNADFDTAAPLTGGLWSPTTHSYYYATGNADAPYLPVQGAALTSGVASSTARARQIARSFEDATVADESLMHYLNYKDVFNGGPAPSCGQNGGWFPQVDADFYAGLPLLGDRAKIPSYINSFTSRYEVDGFFGAGSSAFSRLDPTRECGNEHWAPLNALPAWGLYTYGYGIQPSHDELVLAPFISREMAGSVVKYTWREVPLELTYTGLASFKVAAPSMPTPIRVRFINQTPGATYHVRVDGGTPQAITADADGNVDKVLTSAGSHTFVCTDCLDTSAPANANPAGTVDDTHPTMRYSAFTGYSGLNPAYYPSATARSSKTKNAYVIVNCPTSCSGFKWYSTKGPNRGLADVYIDEKFVQTVDSYAPSLTPSAVVWDSGVLPPGAHTMRILVRAERNVPSTDNWVEFDRVTRSFTTSIDDTAAGITYSGMGAFTGLDLTFNDRSTAHSSKTAGHTATYACTSCTQLTWSGTRSTNRGNADVLIDGNVVATVDTYAASLTPSEVLYASPVLAPGPHTITVRVKGTKRASSSNYWVEVDAMSWRSE